MGYMEPVVRQNNAFVTVGVVDNDPMVADAFEMVFRRKRAPIDVLWTAASAEEALALCGDVRLRPEVALVDVQMPGMDGLQCARVMRRRYPETGVVAITAFQNSYGVADMRDAGIAALVHKDEPVGYLVQTIGGVAGNEQVVCWQERSLSVQRMMLTDMELAVLREYLKGRTVESVAARLYISVGTVKTHLNKAYRKLGVHSRAQAVELCVREGLI